MHNLFSGGGSEASCTTFDIQLDADHVLLYGDAYEAEDTYLKGRLVFHNNSPIKVLAIKISLIGEHCVTFTNALSSNPRICQQGQFHKQEEILFQDSSSSLPAGTHSWPFEFPIKGHQLESLYGMPDTFFTYRLKAVIERGPFVKDHKAYRSVRLVRTHDPTSVSLSQSVAVDKIWPDKIKYNLSTHSKAAVFGSLVPCELSLIPLAKGLKIGKITIILMEEQEFHTKQDTNLLVSRYPYTRELEILSDIYKVPAEVESEEIDGLEGFRFTRQVQIPRDLAACRLSIDPVLPHESTVQPYPLVKIKHLLKFVISLVNADGHISEIRAKLPLALFLTPNQRLNSKNQLLNSGVIPMSNNPDIIASEFGAPPSYGQHQTDETLDATNMADNGFATTVGYLSSRGSASNLQGLPIDQQREAFSANTLYNRLADLQVDSPSNNRSNEYFLTADTHGSGTITPRLLSGAQTPAHMEYDAAAMSRVPSYNTANQSSPPRSASHLGLPTYNEVASSPATLRSARNASER